MSATRPVIPMSDSAGDMSALNMAPTQLPDLFLDSDVARRALSFRLPLYEELPSMLLYRDQVIDYVGQLLGPLSPESVPWLTPSMINNYVKERLIPAPVKKRYGREQVARLLIICIFKQFLSIEAIDQLFTIQKITYSLPQAYDYVARCITDSIHRTLLEGKTDHAGMIGSEMTREKLLVIACADAFASKAFLMIYLSFAGFDRKN